MRTVHEVSQLTGVSIRTLQYYDRIGLLKPTEYSEAGYRLYDDTALETLQQILLFRELEFPLKEIKDILSSPDFDRNQALEQQITLLTLKKEHLENLIDFARGIWMVGVKTVDFSAFDTRKIDEYTARAKAQWGKTPEYREFVEKAKNWSPQDEQEMADDFMKLFAEFGSLRQLKPDSPKVQGQVKKLQTYITEHFYQCSNEILLSLGQMYSGGGEFMKNIDSVGGEGTAEFVTRAIEVYCESSE